jgi:pimeloyl-ACP methyl ester carboxylesterase
MTRRIRTAIALAATLLLAGCQSGFDGPGQILVVSGGQVHLWCEGDSGVSIVFLSAIGGDDTLVPIAERLADDAIVCFYDRPGDGDTEPPDQPRSAADDAADLHELLSAAEIATPAVLVAHSYGNLVALVAAAEHPEDVAGLVMVDGSHPTAEAEMYTVMTDAQRESFDGEMANFPHVDWPTSLADAEAALPGFPDIP